MTINVFGSKLNDEPDEVFHSGGMSVRDWLSDNVDNFSDMDVHPIRSARILCTKPLNVATTEPDSLRIPAAPAALNLDLIRSCP